MDSERPLSRRSWLRQGAVGGMAWLTPLASMLARAQDKEPLGKPPRSVILLWMAGGPSQLETFDPHPSEKIAHGSKAIRTSAPGVLIGDGLPRLAEQMSEVTVLRSVVSKEADHERAVYAVKTGYRPSTTVVHPSIGAVICHQLSDAGMDLPRHISIVPEQWPARGGYLGAQYDAFLVQDPKGPIQDATATVSPKRMNSRMQDVDILERSFAQGRVPRLDESVTQHRQTMGRALKLMSSEQLAAFDVKRTSAAQRAAYGDTAFGRGCLAALRLVEAGVRCVEVTLGGWDTHVNNHALQRKRLEILDPAFSALLIDLKARSLLESTVVVCGGEFGRTPRLNPLEGRDHWPYGFSMAVAGGGFRGGRAYGATDPAGEKKQPSDPVQVEDLHATILHSLGINPAKELVTPVGRPLALSEGRIIRSLLRS